MVQMYAIMASRKLIVCSPQMAVSVCYPGVASVNNAQVSPRPLAKWGAISGSGKRRKFEVMCIKSKPTALRKMALFIGISLTRHEINGVVCLMEASRNEIVDTNWWLSLRAVYAVSMRFIVRQPQS